MNVEFQSISKKTDSRKNERHLLKVRNTRDVAGEMNDPRASNLRLSLLVMIHHDGSIISCPSDKR